MRGFSAAAIAAGVATREISANAWFQGFWLRLLLADL
jgi:hypothetical protein